MTVSPSAISGSKKATPPQKPAPLPKLPLDNTAQTAQEIWGDYFSKRTPAPGDVSRLAMQLHKAKKHDHVIALINAAMLNGQVQPWMYDVLAMSMEIAGRPKKQIERVLLSRLDFTATDVPNMIYSAAYLTRFGGEQQALQLYRQASKLQPTRPEPYVLGLKLADKLKNYDGIEWAAAGVLAYVWTPGFQNRHQSAIDIVTQSEKDLRKAGEHQRADKLVAAVGKSRQRDLVLKLAWNGTGDLDLSVEEPLGTVCSYANAISQGGGIHIHDGYGPDQKNCYEEYICPYGIAGDYRVRIRHEGGTIVGKRAILTIIRAQGGPKQEVRTMPIVLDQEETVVRFNLPHGRRKKLSEKPHIERAVRRPSDRKTSRLPTIRDLGPAGRRVARDYAQSRRQRPGAVGFTPVVQVIPEGVSLNGTAIISADRRYVRISMTPIFNTITDVFTFTFQGPGAGTQTNPGVNGGGGNQQQ